MEEPVAGLEAALENEQISVLLGGGEGKQDDVGVVVEDEGDENLLPTAEVCRIIRSNMQNMERSLRCPLCLSCTHNAMMIGACCHVYCRLCIITALQLKKECPTCKHPCTKRALVPAPQFDELVRAYKSMLRNFGLAPARFDPNIPITQLLPEEDEDSYKGDDEEQLGENVIEEVYEDSAENSGIANRTAARTPRSAESNREVGRVNENNLHFLRRKRLSLDWMNLHEHVQAARTFARHLKGSVCSQREQAAVVSVNERAWVQAAVVRQHPKQYRYHKYQNIHVSLSQEIREQAQEQQAADALLLSSASLEVHGRSSSDDEEEDDRKPAALLQPLLDEDFLTHAGTLAEEESLAQEVLPENEEALPPITPVAIRLKMVTRKSSGSSSPRRKPTSLTGPIEPPVSEKDPEPDPANKSVKEPFVAVNPFGNETEPLTEAAAALGVLRDDGASLTAPLQAAIPSAAVKLPNNNTSFSFKGDGEDEIERSAPSAQPQDSTYVPPCAGLDENSPSRTVLRRRDFFSVGSIVEVESRTWPGVNKQGGVGRVTRVHHQDNDGSTTPSVFYDIAYVLGGKETMVDAVFVSGHENPLGRDREAGSLRLRFSNIPQSLLDQLEAEGFDTVGRPSLAMFHNSRSSEKAKENKRPPMPTSPRKRLSAGSWDSPANLDPNLLSRAARAKQSLSGKRMRDEDDDSSAELNSDRAKCQRADEHYQAHIREAIKKGVVNLMTSSLSREEAEGVVNLCKNTKGAPVKIKLNDVLSKRTTLCLMPVQEYIPPNVTASCRTLKGMRAALAGIPLVATSWIDACLQTGQVVHPETSMFIRTLPTKLGNGVTDYGVAYMAALIQLGSTHKALKNCFVYLCGKYTRQVETDMLLLAREAGATILTQAQCVVPKIRMDKSKVVLLCNKTADSSITETLSSETKQYPQNVLCVTAQWLFDSVSSGECQDARAYPPETDCEVAKGLWVITTTAQDVGQTGFFGTTAF